MSTTLTNGLKLPDKGSVDWYADMQNNYTILDGAVGTVAEHTTALAGKAPLVHTHSKADITDLFNSANTWSGDNTFSKAVGFTKVNATTLYAQNARVELGDSGLSGDSYNQISFWDKNGDNLSYLRQTYNTDGTNVLNIFVRNKFLNGVPNTAGTVDYAYFGLILNADKSKEGVLRGTFRPYDNNTYDLGSSSYQWNNLYAKNYYYNGVAWGLDKVNTWTAQQKIVGNNSRGTVSIYNPAYTKGSALSSTDLSIGSIYMGDGGQTGLANSLAFISADLAANGARTLLSLSAMENTASSGTRANIVIQYDKNDAVNPKKVTVQGTVFPHADATYPLGTPTLRWKSLNGINPGALSLPDYSDTTYIDISGSIVPPSGQTTINYSGGENQYTPPVDGWLSIRCDGATFLQIYRNAYNCPGTTASRQGASGKLVVTLPVLKNTTYTIKINTSGTTNVFQLYPCLGNV